MAAPSAVDAVLLHGFAALSDRVSGFVDRDAALLEPMRAQLALQAVKLVNLRGDTNTVWEHMVEQRGRRTSAIAQCRRGVRADIEELRAHVGGVVDELREARGADMEAQALEDERARNAEFQRRMLADVAAMRAEIDELRRARSGPY